MNDTGTNNAAAIGTEARRAGAHDARVSGAVPGSGSGPAGDPGVGELIQRAAAQASELVRAEVRLAVTELQEKGRHAGRGAGMFGGAGLVALYGTGAALVAVTAALDLVLPLWAAALIVAVVLLGAAAVLGLAGRRQFAQATPPVPEEAAASTRRDIEQIKEHLHR